MSDTTVGSIGLEVSADTSEINENIKKTGKNITNDLNAAFRKAKKGTKEYENTVKNTGKQVSVVADSIKEKFTETNQTVSKKTQKTFGSLGKSIISSISNTF